jgi:biopolymer transport protein ExbD
MAAASSDNFELNLTPLLDMILQLIMFFMMCVNFVAEQVNANVLLPSSNSAQEIQAKTETSMVVINVEVEREPDPTAPPDPTTGKQPTRPKLSKDGQRMSKIMFAGKTPIAFTEDRRDAAIVEAQRALKNFAAVYRKQEALRLHKPESQIDLGKIPIIIRADAETRYGVVVLLMAQCVREGFTKVELRAYTKTNL